MNLIIQLKKRSLVFLVGIVLACFGLLPRAEAVGPAPDGGYPLGNTAEGQNALLSLTTGGYNTAVGFFSLSANTTGTYNTAAGAGALDLNTGDNNTATGAAALLLNTTGHDNTANGVDALAFNEPGNNNTATGAFALFSNTEGSLNTATGSGALFANTTGNHNTANGYQALYSNITGTENVAVGDFALLQNTTSSGNTAVGAQTLLNTTGAGNTAVGSGALVFNTTGIGNTAVGLGALYNNTTGNHNIAVGYLNAGFNVATADNVICIGSLGADVSNTTWIGNVYGVTTQNTTTAPVVVSADGQLGTVASSERFKKDISTMENASEAILALRPVTFHYTSDRKNTPQFGLIAEEVAEVNPALVLPDKEGKPYTVRYEAVNAMLLNEFLKEHRKTEKLEATVARLQKQIEALTAGLQKVNAQLEASKPAPQVVSNP